MARVTVEDCVEKVPNRFQLVLLAAHRARVIRQGSPITIDRDNDKDPVVALREIADETVDLETIRDSLVAELQEVRPNEEAEKEADKRALVAAPASSEEEVLKAYQVELESAREERFLRGTQGLDSWGNRRNVAPFKKPEPDKHRRRPSRAAQAFLRQNELVDRVKAYQPDADEDELNKAYVYAVMKHGQQMRHSGDPYFAHPVSVAGLAHRPQARPVDDHRGPAA